MNTFQHYFLQIIETTVLIGVLLLIRWLLKRAIINFTNKIERLERRVNLIMKHLSIAMVLLFIIFMLIIWGVDLKHLGLVFSSVFAVIGIALFAQWSILCNITSGIVMFFTFPYKIGDYIKIHDKDIPCEGYIEDIKTFHVILITQENEIVTYPNSLMLQKGVSIKMKPPLEEENSKDAGDKHLDNLPHD